MACKICGSKENIVTHHLSYTPEITETLCRSCHGAIHSHDPTSPKHPDWEYYQKYYKGFVKPSLNLALLNKFQEEFPEVRGMTPSQAVDWALRFLLKLKEAGYMEKEGA